MEKKVAYTRTFYDIAENERQVETWLKKHGGTETEDWRLEYRGNYYIAGGWDQSDVLTVGDVVVEIFNPSVAYQFELFKVGGRLRDRRAPTDEELELDYEYLTEHASKDKPVWFDPNWANNSLTNK